MKCQYRFRIEGKLTLSENKPLSIRGHVYEFETREGRLVTHIKVTKTLKQHFPLFSVDRVASDYPEIEWLPEDDAELNVLLLM